MMQVVLTILLAFHGTLHVLGFLKWSRLATLPRMPGRALVALSSSGERVFAVLWLVAMLALLTAAALRTARNDSWSAVALAGVFLSQGLIIVAWSDARFGTIINVFILIPALVALAQARFSRRTDGEIEALLSRASPSAVTSVASSELEGLPPPVRRWLEASGIVGREPARTVRLKQRGELRTSPDAGWMQADAEQYFTIEPPGFIWRVDTTMMTALPIVGRDKYAAGRGHMLIKAAAMLDVVNAADEKIDQGSMLRFLGELVWFPSAALAPYITWEPIDRSSAKATMRHGGLEASAVFTFSEHGRFLGLRAQRYLGSGKDAKLTPWFVSCSEWRSFRGIEVPNRGVVGWALDAADFVYYRWEILDVEPNVPELYDQSTSRREKGAHVPAGEAAHGVSR